MLKRVLSLVVMLILSATIAWAAPTVIAAKFHSDNCASCKAMAPALDEVMEKYTDNDELAFVIFDRTDDASSQAAVEQAAAMGLAEIYEATPKTGVVLLIDAETKEVRGKLTKTYSAVDMAMTIDAVLGGENVLVEMEAQAMEMKGSDHDHGSMKGSH